MQLDNACKITATVKTLDDVSVACKSSRYCKSRLLPSGMFRVETFVKNNNCPDPRETWLFENVKQENKIASLNKLLEMSGFNNVINEKCANKGRDCKIIIKANFAPSMEKEDKSYTDPELIDHVADLLEKDHDNVTIFEMETKLSDFSPVFKPDILAKRLDPPFRHEVKNLTPEQRQTFTWKSGNVDISKPVIDADVIINMGKIKPIAEYRISMALKNMYGALPEKDRYHHFHWKRSGFDVEDATLIANHAMTPDFVILDGIQTRDFDSKKLFTLNTIVAGRDPLFIDKFLSLKTGAVQDISTITQREASFRGNFDVKNYLGIIHSYNVQDVMNGIELNTIPDNNKLNIFTDQNDGRKWKAPSDLDNIMANAIQFGIPSSLNLPDSVIKPLMCFESKYTVMTDEEYGSVCGGLQRGLFAINRFI